MAAALCNILTATDRILFSACAKSDNRIGIRVQFNHCVIVYMSLQARTVWLERRSFVVCMWTKICQLCKICDHYCKLKVWNFALVVWSVIFFFSRRCSVVWTQSHASVLRGNFLRNFQPVPLLKKVLLCVSLGLFPVGCTTFIFKGMFGRIGRVIRKVRIARDFFRALSYRIRYEG